MTPILNKCVEELKLEKPRIDYVLGLLEALIETQPTLHSVLPHPQNVIGNPALTDEAAIMDARARAVLQELKDTGEVI